MRIIVIGNIYYHKQFTCEIIEFISGRNTNLYDNQQLHQVKFSNRSLRPNYQNTLCNLHLLVFDLSTFLFCNGFI